MGCGGQGVWNILNRNGDLLEGGRYWLSYIVINKNWELFQDGEVMCV